MKCSWMHEHTLLHAPYRLICFYECLYYQLTQRFDTDHKALRIYDEIKFNLLLYLKSQLTDHNLKMNFDVQGVYFA